jgi:hypothetical protein
MTEPPSSRVVDQRVRNRVIDAVEVLAGGPDGVRSASTAEYINMFFDVVDDDMPGDWRDLSTYTKAEVIELERVLGLMLDAVAATPEICTDDEFIASGWPERIQPFAARALATMLRRGRFREDVEEDAASLGPRPN